MTRRRLPGIPVLSSPNGLITQGLNFVFRAKWPTYACHLIYFYCAITSTKRGDISCWCFCLLSFIYWCSARDSTHPRYFPLINFTMPVEILTTMENLTIDNFSQGRHPVCLETTSCVRDALQVCAFR